MDNAHPDATIVNIRVTLADGSHRYLATTSRNNLKFVTDQGSASTFIPESDGAKVHYVKDGRYMDVGVGKKLEMRKTREDSWVLTSGINPSGTKYLQKAGSDLVLGLWTYNGEPDYTVAYGVPLQGGSDDSSKPERLPVAIIPTGN